MYNIDYFKRDDSSSEVEFLIEKECSVVPVEVKAKKRRHFIFGFPS